MVRLLGAVQAQGAGAPAAQPLERWPSRAVAALLARLALAPERVHPREELVELLWPGVALDVGRNRLRQVLSTLKSLLEPPSANAYPVLRADRLGVGVVPGALDSDVRLFERLVRAGQTQAALNIYRGELMPGYFDEWVVQERQRLANIVERLQANAGLELARESHETLGTRSHNLSTEQAQVTAQVAAHVATRESSVFSTGLPSYWTRPFGADAIVAQLVATVRQQRLVTVHGPGGSGKTRLAVQAARDMQPSADGSAEGSAEVSAVGSAAANSHGQTPRLAVAPAGPHFERIAFVSLIDCTDAAQALDAICAALRIEAAGDPRARIVAALDGCHTLLVLDNLEQLVDAAGAELAHLLAAAPLLHVLITSRRLLELDGENAFELEGLPLPDPDPDPDAEALAAHHNPAVALFLDRARAARADFRLGPRNASAVLGLVRLLGGMPLAIELAASRVRSLTPQELLQHLLNDAGTPMLDLLARGGQRPNADARHASMRHVVAWSWQQLTAPQVALMQALSVLTAPGRLETIAAVAQQESRRVQSLLIDLHDASLVIRHEGDDDITRYALLQPVREFAAEHVSAEQTRAARCHLREWLIQFARHSQGKGPAVVAAEIAHVHAAITSAVLDREGNKALELAASLRSYWDSDNPPLTVMSALEQLMGTVAAPGLRCDVLELLTFSRSNAGYADQALAFAQQALDLAQDDRQRSMALSRRVWAQLALGRFDNDFDTQLDDALRLAQSCGDLPAQGYALRAQAVVASNVRLDFAVAERLMDQGLAIWERTGHRTLVELTVLGRASMQAWTGRNHEALAVFQTCEAKAQTASDWMLQHIAARQMGRVYLRVRNGPAAVGAFQRSLRLAWSRRYVLGVVHGLLHLPQALVTPSDLHAHLPASEPPTTATLEAAARLRGFALSHWQRLFGTINRIEQRELCRARRLLRLHLGGARVQSLYAEGEAMSMAEAVRVGLALSRAAPA